MGGSGDIAITPDGARAYVAAGLVYIIDTATNAVVKSFPAETAAIPTVTNNATSVAISPDGKRAYVGVYTFDFTGGGFGAGGSIVLVDTASEAVTGAIDLGSLPGPIALTPDGSRLYVGIQSTFVNTGYGSGFLPGRHIVVVDTIAANAFAAIIILGNTGNTASGDRRDAGSKRRLRHRSEPQRRCRRQREHELRHQHDSPGRAGPSGHRHRARSLSCRT